MRRFVLSLALPFAVMAAPAFAAGCDNPKTGFDEVYCFAKVFMELDSQLSQNYQALMKSIPVGQQAILRDGQRAWIRQRDAQCYADTGGKHVVDIKCSLKSTRDRVQFLSDRMAECRARGCNVARLGGLEGNE